MRKITFSLFIALLVLGSSCHKEYFDSGDFVIEFRDIDTNYTQVILDGAFDLIVTQDPSFTLKIEGGENKIRHLITEVIDNVLYIEEEKNNVINDKQNKVFISKYYLERISLRGSGDINAENLSAQNFVLRIDGSGDARLNIDVQDNMNVDIEGSGNVILDGGAEELFIDIEGSGDVDGRYFPVLKAFIHVDGSGDVYVSASELLSVIIDGSGDVFYLGNPDIIETNISGSGNVEPY